MKPNARHEVMLGFAITVIAAVAAGLIAIIPEIDTIWEGFAAIVVSLFLLIPASATAFRELHHLLVKGDLGDEVTGYKFDSETGRLVKGSIDNVALRVSSMHKTIDALVSAVPEQDRHDALFDAGYSVGENWARAFRKETWKMDVSDDDLPRVLYRWSEYDASAGMGRISVALTADLNEGYVMISNSFLSREPATFPLDHWFSGYIAGTLCQLLPGRYAVELIESGQAALPSVVSFRVTLIA